MHQLPASARKDVQALLPHVGLGGDLTDDLGTCGWHTGSDPKLQAGRLLFFRPVTKSRVTDSNRQIERAWNQTIPGKCLPVGPTFYGLAAFTIISDVSVIFLPIPLLLQLNVKPAQKAGVVCLFLLGLFTTICSILRLTQINRVVAIDGDSTMLVLWGTIEFNVGVSWTSSAKIERDLTDVQNIVTSLPFLTPLLKVWVRDFQSRSGGEHRKNTGYTLQSYSKNRRSQLRSENSKEPVLAQRTPSEELILDADDSSARANAEIHVTVEYRVSHENHK